MPAATTNMDELALKVALARLVPEVILFRIGTEESMPYSREGFFWHGKYGEDRLFRRVTDEEWLAVVALCEWKLNTVEYRKFADELWKLARINAKTNRTLEHYLSSKWQTRATALLTVKGLLP